MTKSSVTTADFVRRARLVHGGHYDYSRVVYINARTKVEIVCPAHGPFRQLPRKHVGGSKCPRCAAGAANDYRRTSLVDFISRASAIHNNYYSYHDIVSLANQRCVVTITCPVHGRFNQTAISHLRGHGCAKCSRRLSRRPRSKPVEYNTQWFVNRALAVHGSAYDYSHTTYAGSSNSVTILCPQHGQFTQVARDHLNGYGCPRCGLNRLAALNARTADEFIAEAVAVHGQKFDYASVVYVNQDTKVSILCPVHGNFLQSPRHHLRGQGCPACHVSAGQRGLLDLVRGAVDAAVTVNRRDIIPPFELDIVVEALALAIEFNGLYWHSYNRPETALERNRHVFKLAAASAAGFQLIQVCESEWLWKRPIVESIILNKLGRSKRIYARDLVITRIADADAADFYNSAHLMGHRPASHHYALSDATGRVLCCMSFSRNSVYGYELIRYATSLGHTVVGGPSRLFAAFVGDKSPSSVLSFADRRYSTGAMYLKLGFTPIGYSRPNYRYVLGTRTFSRQEFQKHKLASKLDVFNAAASESANMFNNGYRRLWDAGHIKLLWRAR